MPSVAPVKNTGGAGFHFETYVGGFICAAILARFSLLGAYLGPPGRVDFQVRSDGWELDDQLVTFGTKRRVAFSIKSYPQINGPSERREFVQQAWKQLEDRPNNPFNPDSDELGLVVADVDSGILTGVRELRRLALEQEDDQLASRIASGSYIGSERAALWNSLAPPTGSQAHVVTDSPASLLRRLRILDVDTPIDQSHHSATAIENCQKALSRPTALEARKLWSALLEVVDVARAAGGYLDFPTLHAELGSRFFLNADRTRLTARLEAEQRRAVASMNQRWVAVGVDESLAADLASDPTIGAVDISREPGDLIVIEGEMGSGKTLAAERAFLSDIDAYMEHLSDAVPVFVRARELSTSLTTHLDGNIPELGYSEPVRLYVDAVDEVGRSAAFRFVQEADAICRSRPGSRALVTSRPSVVPDPISRIAMPGLTDAQKDEVSERLASRPFSSFNFPQPIRDAATQPLFALIAIRLGAERERRPGNRAQLVEALVKDALRGADDEAFEMLDLLAGVAQKSISSAGSVSESDLGGPDFVKKALRSRLVVQEDRSLRFALPIFEQYFGAFALLRNRDALESAVDSLSSFERWRYAFVVAVGVGGWEQTQPILELLGSEWPGAAYWVIREAISTGIDSNVRSGATVDASERLGAALEVQSRWLSGVRSLTGLERADGSLLQVRTHITDNGVTAWLTDGKSTGLDGLDLHRSRWRSSMTPAGEGWPWHWARQWWSAEVEHLLRSRAFPVKRGSKLWDERQWALARRLTGVSGNVGQADLESKAVAEQARQVAEAVGETETFNFEHNGRLFRKVELLSLEQHCVDLDGAPLRRPWPKPDLFGESGGPWIWNVYSKPAMARLAKSVLEAAVAEYVRLVEEYFPRWTPTLSLAAAMPIELDVSLTDGISQTDYGIRWIYALIRVLPDGDPNQIAIRTSEDRATIWSDRSKWVDEINRREQLRPQSSGWANRLGEGISPSVLCHDTPATDLAYDWLWADLHSVGFLGKAPPPQV